MPVILHKLDLSPPARAAMMACEIYGVPVDMKDVNLLEKEHHTPEFLKKNPLHTIPVLEDGNLIIHDSHAILMYLADTYGKNDSMYPKDVKKRALVNQMLFFDATILFTRLRNVTYAAIVEGQRKVLEKHLKDIDEAYGFLEEFLTRNKYVSGERLTIADIAAFATATSLCHIVPIEVKKYPKIQAWVKELEKQPYSQKHNAPGVAMLEELIKKCCDL